MELKQARNRDEDVRAVPGQSVTAARALEVRNLPCCSGFRELE